MFNKKTWHDRSSERRQIWTPIAATTGSTGDLVIEQGSEPQITCQVFDEFDVFPCNLNAVIKDPPQQWWHKMDDQNAS